MKDDWKHITEELRKAHQSVCRRFPSEWENGAGVIARQVNEDHVKLIFWAADAYGVVPDTYNLHAVIQNYKQMKQITKALPKVAEIIDTDHREDGTRIRPRHFIEYFRTHEQGASTLYRRCHLASAS